uniref:Uncharacterized protein n=1 Tax=Romanomermis culicivorax TaxID=13658 RepID=A0A915IZH7_ROMCU
MVEFKYSTWQNLGVEMALASPPSGSTYSILLVECAIASAFAHFANGVGCQTVVGPLARFTQFTNAGMLTGPPKLTKKSYFVSLAKVFNSQNTRDKEFKKI